MIRCPSCGEEIQAGGAECTACAGRIDEPRPPADPMIQLRTVFSSGDPALIALAKSLLENERIDFVVRGEGVQDLFGSGRLGAGFNIVTGPAEFVVREQDAGRARELLRDLTSSES